MVEVLYKEHYPETRIDTGFAPIGLDEPYRVIISEDPIGFNGGTVNLFEYAGNNPVNFVDPSGLRKYTILDWPGPETPFEIYHFEHEFLDKVAEQKVKDPTYKAQWDQLSKDYAWWNAVIDFYRFDVDEAIQHYRKKFEKKKKSCP